MYYGTAKAPSGQQVVTDSRYVLTTYLYCFNVYLCPEGPKNLELDNN